eukprot:CAMPEP_0198732954 /NCGR_PEP_ID=MMETSP1475-20131203/41324_1 /TAXON_ID= ORGANISM="Unidentified sp., Strain CCMP1999" /NCGR_SAMPLE_ID=MMETSP1475 /ASSEMBLY_ACC=CAM_ASM_001111 /LENGTH=621 /DNA_ID=CAMNT_0044496167 /DNA_START=153 /DNA_END=2018 /DNA_ORIENTATION=-
MTTPSTVKNIQFPKLESAHSSPEDWRNELIYFLMVDRFSDGKEHTRKPYKRGQPGTVDWQLWAESGKARYQGGTLDGARSKLDYLKNMGVTTLWISPIAKQRKALDTYHGYSSQDFLNVEPRLGTIESLRALVDEAHSKNMRVIIDIVFNHSGCNWVYSSEDPKSPEYTPNKKRGFGGWLAADETPTMSVCSRDDGVWPEELQKPEIYHRAGTGNLGEGDVFDPLAENKRSDFFELRSIDHRAGNCLKTMIAIFKWWISATDCDGFRLDTVKHVTIDTARRFCAAIKEHAESIGKKNFLVVGEIAGGNSFQEMGQEAIGDCLDGTLDIGEGRVFLTEAALGNDTPTKYFDMLDGNVQMAKYRCMGRYVTVLDDHDLVSMAPDTERLRFSQRTDKQERVLLALGVQLFGPGIPCIYYGTEQALTGPVPKEAKKEIEEWGIHDHFLRETMFGAEHARVAGKFGTQPDPKMPGFAAFGAVGTHVFDESFWLYKCIQKMTHLRNTEKIFRTGSYMRTAFFNQPDGLMAFSRILGVKEAFVVMNFSKKPVADGSLFVHVNPSDTKVEVIFNSEQMIHEARGGKEFKGSTPVGSKFILGTTDEHKAFLRLPTLKDGQVLIFMMQPEE